MRIGRPFGHPTTDELATQSVNGEDRAIPLDVVFSDVVKEPTSLADHHEQATTGVVVVLVFLEVVVEIGDSRRKDRDLHLGRSGIGLAGAVCRDDCCFVDHGKSEIFR